MLFERLIYLLLISSTLSYNSPGTKSSLLSFDSKSNHLDSKVFKRLPTSITKLFGGSISNPSKDNEIYEKIIDLSMKGDFESM